MSAHVLFNNQVPFAFSLLIPAKAPDVNNRLPFQLKENMVNHKKMVHPPCPPAV